MAHPRTPQSNPTEQRHVIALSGPVCAGKTTLGQGLRESMNLRYASTRAELESVAHTRGRLDLQKFGQRLDVETRGGWVTETVKRVAAGDPLARAVVVDAVRTAEQLVALRQEFRVVHVHLTASQEILAQRYELLRSQHAADELPSYADVSADPTEAAIGSLAVAADLQLDTSVSNGATVLATTRQALSALLPPWSDPTTFSV